MANYKIIASNKRAKYDYEITGQYIAGLVLYGWETKSIRNGHVSLKNSFAKFSESELWAHNIHISPYQLASQKTFEPTRPRKLLLRHKELIDLLNHNKNGLSVVILSIGSLGRFLKVQIGYGRGKKNYDKRELIKQRQSSIESSRKLKNYHHK